jgi:ribosomal protein L40E
MNRRHFLQLPLSAPAAPHMGEPKPEPLLRREPAEPIPPENCRVCGSSDVRFDQVLDINVCNLCGAHETTKGWQKR